MQKITKGFLLSMFLRFIRGTVSTFLSTLAILIPLGLPMDEATFGLALGIGLLSGFGLAFDKGWRGFKEL